MNVAFSEILNSQLNSLAKTSEITKNLLTVCIDNAISEKEDDNIENAPDEEMTVSTDALLKMRWAVKMVRQLEMKMCSAITSHFEKRNLSSVNVIESVLKEKFVNYNSSWEFVACVFVLIDNLIWKEWFLAREGGCEENYIANVNGSIAYPIGQFLDETINYWVFFNGGWAMFLKDSSNTWYDFLMNCSEILRQLCDFILTL